MLKKISKIIFKLIFKPIWSTREISRLIYLYNSNKWFEKNFSFLKIEKKSFRPQTDDLKRISDHILKFKPKFCLEYGSGISSIIILNAMSTYTSKGKLVSIESEKRWSKNTEKMVSNSNIKGDFDLKILKPIIEKVILKLHYTKSIFWYPSKINVSKGNFICLRYQYVIKNYVPDFIYIDGPDPMLVNNSKNGFSNKSLCLPPISGDLLKIEPFLLPGTLVVIDGRTSNARFLKNNLQRNWAYFEDFKNDQNILYLDEKPIGKINLKQIKFYKS